MPLLRRIACLLALIADTRQRLYYYNTHFPHRREDEQARLKAARLILGRIEAVEPGVPFILTGDFNAPAGGEVYRLFADRLADAWVRAEHRSGPECTFGASKASRRGQGLTGSCTAGLSVSWRPRP